MCDNDAARSLISLLWMFDSSPAHMKIKIEIIADAPKDTTITDIITLKEMIKALDRDRPFNFDSIDITRIDK